MKVIIYIFLYIFLTGLYFFSLSLFGCLWFSYKEVITNSNWFIIYILIFHWWLVGFSLMEYYDKYLNNLF